MLRDVDVEDSFLKSDFFRVPDTFQLGAILSYTAFLASRKINRLRVFNTPEYSNSPRLHHLFVKQVCVFWISKLAVRDFVGLKSLANRGF
jgi:hypothetical protein